MGSESTGRAALGFGSAGEERGKQLLPPDAELPREVGGGAQPAPRSPAQPARETAAIPHKGPRHTMVNTQTAALNKADLGINCKTHREALNLEGFLTWFIGKRDI